ncbi:MAG: amidohydrolase family protein [Candidatus Latescibacteria bacterium]|nr:amidohydrolase family protein [Candidatus Latescibacterota bacterium]
MNLSPLRAHLRPPCPVLDVHVHPLACFEPRRVSSVREDVEILTVAAQRSGVTKLCVFSLSSPPPHEPTMPQCREANDYVLAMRDLAPDWFLPFCYVNPMYPDESVVEMERCIARERMVGVKLWVARRATDPGLDPILRYAVTLDVPVLQHAWLKTTGNLPGESFPADVANLARRHPRARLIMAHLNGCGMRGLEAVRACPNVVVDTSGGDPESGMVELAVARLGADRVVYGSDAPIRHFGVVLGKTLGTNLSDTVQQAILWDNAARLLPSWAGVKPLAEAAV